MSRKIRVNRSGRQSGTLEREREHDATAAATGDGSECNQQRSTEAL
jgi:hypothetical protein